jgi:putative lipoprotein
MTHKALSVRSGGRAAAAVLWLGLGLGTAMVAGGCAGTTVDDRGIAMATVSGEVSYLARIAMPPKSTLTVRLQDVSRADAPAVDLGKQVITDAAGVPVAFAVRYNPAEVRPEGVYVISATLEADGRVMFRTTEQFRVITKGFPERGVTVTMRGPG